jgi:hypothetical protein
VQHVLLATSSRRCVALPALLEDPDMTAPAALEVLFLEDADLLGLAALPFSREVGLASGIARDVARHDIENALARAARVSFNNFCCWFLSARKRAWRSASTRSSRALASWTCRSKSSSSPAIAGWHRPASSSAFHIPCLLIARSPKLR